MKKIAVFMMLVFIIIAGCSNKSDTSTEKTGAETKEKQEKSLSNEQASKQPVLKYIKEGTMDANIVAPGFLNAAKEKEINAITKKMQKSLANKQEWFKAYISKTKKGEKLPYHPNFGITEKEYRLLLNSDHHIRLKKIGDTSLTITKEGDQLILKTDNTKIIKTVYIDLKKNTVKTEAGTLKYDGKIKASKGQVVTGEWSGEAWALKGKSPEDMSAEFYIGKLKDTGETLVTFRINQNTLKAEEMLKFK
ncbi:hypothetical protein [Bacillus changyiensis]|uniref:hypothetical protein n=1 Tax=Bacillus changyiensis TaxID=3004103 RepID=UPI0022DFB9ED|nr:hypothetical protein [Bacillus changyiensis]MDA1476322.1 hypothetical protein [Bacillus changyiensis]